MAGDKVTGKESHKEKEVTEKSHRKTRLRVRVRARGWVTCLFVVLRLKSYQDGFRLVTVSTHGDNIVVSLGDQVASLIDLISHSVTFAVLSLS